MDRSTSIDQPLNQSQPLAGGLDGATSTTPPPPGLMVVSRGHHNQHILTSLDSPTFDLLLCGSQSVSNGLPGRVRSQSPGRRNRQTTTDLETPDRSPPGVTLLLPPLPMRHNHRSPSRAGTWPGRAIPWVPHPLTI